MTIRIDRRRLLGGGLSLAALATLGPGAARAQDARLRLLWWGSQGRADRTFAVTDLFTSRHPEVAIEGESAGWDAYWPRLATQTAGGNPPDIIQMDYRYIFEYARRGVLLPFDDHIPDTLDLSGFAPEAVAGGQVDGQTFGISLGANSSAMMVNTAAFEEAGIELPEHGITWEEFADRCEALTNASERARFYGVQDGGGLEPTFECWLRQRGRALYTEEGALAFDADDAAEWFAFWADMRARGACVPPDVQALDQLNIETGMVTLGHAAISFAHSNQIVGYQNVNEAPLVMVPYPTAGEGSQPGQYRKPSMFFSASARTQHPELVAQYINFFVTDLDAGEILDVERGVPEDEAVREHLRTVLDEPSRVQIDFIESLGQLAGPLPPPPPQGAGEIQFLLKRINEEIGFGAATPESGAQALIAEATTILERS